MEARIRIFIKMILAMVLGFLLIWLIYTDEKKIKMTQPEGELMMVQDVKILLRELAEAGAGGIDKKSLEGLLDNFFTDESEQLSYEGYLKILDYLLPEEGQSGESDRLKDKITYNKYKDNFFVLKEDWYKSFEQLIKYFGLEETFKQEKIEIICGGKNLAGEEEIGEGCLLAAGGKVYTYLSQDFAELEFTSVNAYVRENRLLTLLDIVPDKTLLKNVWIMEAKEENIQFFYEGFEILADTRAASENPAFFREQVGDVSFTAGNISSISVKKDRISGKLLSVSDKELEVEGYGSFLFKEGCVGYKLYEELRIADKSELFIGYDFADFVLEDGEVCAFLNTRKEKMEKIRVAVKSNGFESLYHDHIKLVCGDDMSVYYGPYDDRKQEMIEAGEELLIEADGKYMEGNRVEVVPVVNTGKIQVSSLKRSQGIPAYRGKMEIACTDQGLLLINEVLLEEYLYSVVPSEMPASYPIESLKAQAVCARTYGYRYLEHPGYGSLGAHVDDSVGFQVYNNIAENVNSTKAVKETTGILLLYNEEPVSTYYYSTSCGYGADAGVWNENQKEELPYLKSTYIAQNSDESEEAKKESQGMESEESKDRDIKKFTVQDLCGEENFRAYITQADENAYEKEEAWFRWTYQVEEMDTELLVKRLKDRYGAGKVFTFTGKGKPEEETEAFELKEPESFKKVYDIRCLKRKEGGVMDELLIETDKGTYKVVSEYNIRYVLNQGGEVIRQDGSESAGASLLPSAYFVIDTIKSKESVVGYTIAGGGYGHGVGMSQNGAKAMGKEGKNCESILSFYFQGCQMGKIY